MSESEEKLGLLEIVHDEEGHLAAYCPYRQKTLEAGTCFACKDCSGLALSPDGKSSYVVCERAAKDGVWVQGGDERPAVIHHAHDCSAAAPRTEP